ncbi:MAG: putative Ig domain-containing protein [Acidimicrobiales bacterium]
MVIRFGRYVRAVLAGSLILGTALTVSAISPLPASAASVVQTIGVGFGPEGISSDGTHVWVANYHSDTVTELAASTGGVIQTIAVGSGPEGISSDGTNVWVANFLSNTVTELNASTGALVQTIDVGGQPDAISSDGTDVWVANFLSNTVTELNATTGALVQTIDAVGGAPYGISSDGTHVWVTNFDNDTVTELDASTGAVVQTIAVGSAPEGISSDGTDVWVANYSDNTVSEIAIKAPQVVSFTSTNPSPVVVGGPSYTPTASGGGSTSPVVLSLDNSSSGCTLTGGVVQFTAAGTCLIDANQAGDANYLPAPQVQQSITVDAQCTPGYYSATGGSPCTAAPPNSYVDTEGATSPTPCPAGTFNPDTGSTSVAACVMVMVTNPGDQSDYINAPITALPNSQTNGIDPVAWSAPGLPDGLMIDPSSGTITGTPITPCVCSVTLMATDANGNVGTASFTWAIVPFAIATSSLPSARPNHSYGPVDLQAAGLGVSVHGYTTTLKWKKLTLPKGMELSSAGVLSGIPNKHLAADTTSITVKVTETVTTLHGTKKVITETTVQGTIPLIIT